MSDHIPHQHEPGCHLCNEQAHREADEEQAKADKEAAAVSGPAIFWGCLVLLVVAGLWAVFVWLLIQVS
ncbi:hypothetical protein [Streptomyces sp. NBC_01304]|uniref:hypothetical protein n=1 Tax=Streptomyces sp. NBC_01304 TaxID=2903818 RepID=UPI002E14B3EC|nr:hypothetical protein OG430_44660 [Streptomyces sp. NBC_01304]